MRRISPAFRCLGLAALCFGCFVTTSLKADDPWVVYEGADGPGKGKHIVFVSGDEEYRSEEALPMLAKILAVRPSEAARDRVHDLLARNKTGQLTTEETAELERFGELEHLMQLVKARAQFYQVSYFWL